MYLAFAALLIQLQVTPQISFSAEKIALIEPVNSGLFSVSTTNPPSGVQPNVLPNAPEPAPEPTPVAIVLLKPIKPATISVNELAAEGRRNQRLWMGLGIAAHSAATFDAWSTRHVITTTGAQEGNPLLRPFAGNSSLYAAIQIGPAVMDYVGKRMMYSRHTWVRRMWWVPQSASFASSLLCGAHNLAVH
jgi:hypothetical protein